MKQNGLLKKAGEASVETEDSKLAKGNKKPMQAQGPVRTAMRMLDADTNEIPDPPPNKD